jgi:excinuclease ABC subunit A
MGCVILKRYPMQNFLVIKGAREHNLKNIDLIIPREKITVITGPSGSGKSSLAIDTIYSEGQRRYVESLSAYARQFIDQLRKPDIDSIEGLSPSIAIDQKTVNKSPRSTVGTITEIYDYLRVLFTRIGKQYCYKCGAVISKQDSKEIIQSAMSLPQGSRIQILAPIIRDRKGEYRKELQEMRREGFIRARIDGDMKDLTHDITLNRYKRHTIEIVIDRLIIKPGVERQTKDAIETALRYSDIVIINLLAGNKDIIFSKIAVCPACGISYPDINPMFFSFNSTQGACVRCNGLGYEQLFEDSKNMNGNRYCKQCNGARLKQEALSIRINGHNIAEIAMMSIVDSLKFFQSLKLNNREKTIALRILREVEDRLLFMLRVGLGYLTLDRSSLTLSGGEAQRIRLATQLGSSLTGVLYILDEPSIGMHPRDCNKLLESLSSIRDAGNTVIVVEHDEETIRWADYIVDMGPSAGSHGGEIIATGSPCEIIKNDHSITGRYLSNRISIVTPGNRRKPLEYIKIMGAREFNLKNINVHIPLNVFTCITGVSGSGKSTLVMEILFKALCRQLYSSNLIPGKHGEISGMEKIKRVTNVDQSPLGKTPRSNPATYSGVFSYIRELFARIPEARIRGYSPSRFSFNLPGGRCESCRGDGLIKVEMHFLPDVYVPCDVCKGKRYNRETLDISYKGKTIADILEMTISEALHFFTAIPSIKQKLAVLEAVGLGYLQLGQPASTLSGGEAQRVKLSRELGKKSKGSTLYILDEPTTGLHFADIQNLLNVINGLVDSGNTVIIIEHNLEVIKSADYIIDLGPGGGDEGGMVIAEGTPEEVSMNPHSYTGDFLKKKLNVPSPSNIA